MIEEKVNSRRLIIDFLVEFPEDYDPNFVIGVIRDYIHLCRFTVGLADVRSYDPNTRVVQNPIHSPQGTTH